MSTPLRVLIVEDSPDDALLVLRGLQRGGYDVQHERVETAEAMKTALQKQTWDLIISDYSMPRFDAPGALQVLKESRLDLPFLIVSGTVGEDTAVAALKAGAHDFIVKTNLTRLIPAIERELREAKIRREHKRAEQALLESELWFRAVFNAQEDAVFVITLDRTVFNMNAAAEKMFGYSIDELRNKSTELLHVDHEHYQKFGEKFGEAFGRGESAHFEFEFKRKDGEIFPTENSISLLNNTYGQPIGIVSVCRDITQRKRVDEDLQRQLSRLAALRAIDMAITASLDLRVTLNVFLDQVTAQLRVDAADILLINPHTQSLEYTVSRGFHSGALRHTRLRLGEGHAGQAALDRRTVTISDLAQEPGEFTRSSSLPSEKFVAYCATPLIAKGKVQGILEIFHRAPLQFEEQWLSFLEALATQAAIAIDNAKLFDDLQRSNLELKLAYETTLDGWSKALDLRDKETEGHTLRVAEMTVRVARAMGMSEVELVHVRRGALLHDIGKMGIPDGVLLKPGPLTEDEWVIMRKHPVYAYELLSPISYLRPALDIPYCHHEKWDGSGYPRGLNGDLIPLAARAFAIVDVWDALRSNRPYRPAWPEEKVREHVRAGSGAHFDPRVVEAFLGISDL